MSASKETLAQIDPNIKSRNSIRIGDIVTSYNKGYHRVLGFFDIDYGNYDAGAGGVAPQVVYEAILSQHFTKVSKVVRSCHISYIKIADPSELIADLEKAIKVVKETFIGHDIS